MDGQALLDRASAIREDKFYDTTYQQHRMVLTGAFIGAAGGAYFGYARKMNLLVTTLLGAVGGAIIAGALLPK